MPTVKTLKRLHLPFNWLLNRGKIHNGIRSSQHFSLKRFKRRFCTDPRGRIQREFCDDDDKGSGGGVGAGGGGFGGAADMTTLLLSTVLTENMHTTSKVSFETRSTGNVSRKVVSVLEPSLVPTVSVSQSTFQPNKVLFSQQKSSTTAYASFTNTSTAWTFLKTIIYSFAADGISSPATSSLSSSSPMQTTSTSFRTTCSYKPINIDRQASTVAISDGLMSVSNSVVEFSSLSKIASKLTRQITSNNTAPIVGALPHQLITPATQSLSAHMLHVSKKPDLVINAAGLNRRTFYSRSTIKPKSTLTKPDTTIAGMEISLIKDSAIHITGEPTAKIFSKDAHARERFYESAINIAIICTIIAAITMSAVFVFVWTLISQCKAKGLLTSR